jgi:tyrosyl-tRNA synthetase
MIEKIEKMEESDKTLKDIEKEAKEVKDLSHLTAEEQYEIIMDKSSEGLESYVGEELLAQLSYSKETGVPLTVKFGIDPTGSDIHIGHGVPLIMLGRFQRMGHKVELLIGDFTAKVGDPTRTNKEREALTDKEIKENMERYIEQVSRVVDFSKDNIEVKYNSEWLGKMNFEEWIEINRQVSANKLVQRDYFRKRVEKGERVSMLELSYPLLMAYDSVVMEPDVEIGGEDQLVNLLWCRELMQAAGKRPETFVTVDILSGTSLEVDEDGNFKKMSKSAGNYIKIEENPNEMYARVMSLPDELMWGWFKNLTYLSGNDILNIKEGTQSGKFHPKDVKRLLSRLVVSTFHPGDEEIVKKAEEIFDQKFGDNKAIIPEDVEVHEAKFGESLIEVLSRITGESNSSLRRSVRGIYILEGEDYKRFDLDSFLGRNIEDGEVLYIRRGKRRFYKIEAVEEFTKEEKGEEEIELLTTYDKVSAIVKNEYLIETKPSLQMLGKSLNSQEGKEKSIYYGTGIATPEALSIGLPFDILGIAFLNEKIRREAGFHKVYHHVADTHAKTNVWAKAEEVEKKGKEVQATLTKVFKNLGLDNFEVILSSSFDQKSDYEQLLEEFKTSDKHDYVKHEMADMEWYRREKNVVLKTGWIIQAKETRIGSDERLFDREYRKFKGEDSMSFIYVKAGKTLDPDRPKASPYIQIPGENRLLLEKNEDVRKKFEIAKDKTPSTINHIEEIIQLYEELFGSLGDLTIEEKVEAILSVCFK